MQRSMIIYQAGQVSQENKKRTIIYKLGDTKKYNYLSITPGKQDWNKKFTKKSTKKF